MAELTAGAPTITHFWLTAMSNNDVIKSMIHDNDKPLLRYLREINSYLAYEKDFQGAS